MTANFSFCKFLERLCRPHKRYMECIIDSIIAYQTKTDDINTVPSSSKGVLQQDSSKCERIITNPA